MSSGSPSGLIARIDKELRELWKPSEDPSAPPLSRVCTMNIEVVSPSRELLERYTPVIDEVTANVPARAILAAIVPDAKPDALTGSATAVCSLEGGKQICSERINLVACGDAAVRVASAIEALLVPEIPTALVWLGRVHVDDPIFLDLATDAHRIILDSEYTSIASVVSVASWARKTPNAPSVSDLAWTRIAPWHELLARFFDAQAYRHLANKITRVTLKQASDPGTAVGPELSLMLGWMATRLGWKTARLGGAFRFKRPDGGNVAVELGTTKRPKGVALGTLATVAVEAADEGATLVGSIERALGSGFSEAPGTTLDADVVAWRLTVGDDPPIEQSLRLGANKAAKWLERTLHRPAVDPAFDESIAFAERIIEDGLTVS